MLASVTEWLDNTAKKYPMKKAIIDSTQALNFDEFRAKAYAIARAIVSINLETKQPVVVYLEKSAKMIVSFIGIAYSGNFYSPIDVKMPESRIRKIVDVLEPSVVITDRDHYEYISKTCDGAKILFYEDIVPETDDVAYVKGISERIIDTDLLYVLFTSGSTGQPKGVSISHRSVIDYIDWVTDCFDITENDSFGNQAPFFFDNSILDIYSMLKTGATLYIIPQDLFSQPVLLLEYILKNSINTIFWVPSALIMVAKIKALKNVDLNGTLKRVLFCGEVMPNKQLNIWRSYLPDVVYANLYGPTEITDACTYYIVDRKFGDDEPLPIGKPMKNTEIIVLDEHDNIINACNVDSLGELCVRGTGVSVGYYRNPEKTKQAFIQNPTNNAYDEKIYRTGDIVHYNEFGELMYVCRKDFQIKHKGHRIELGEIETAVSSLDEISLCCCLYDEKRNRIVLFAEGMHKKEEINHRISSMIPEYMLPGKLICVESMPLNQNGKIDRGKLRDEFLS